MDNKLVEFLKNNLGFIIGLIIGCIVVILKIGYVFLNIAIMISFGLLGAYVQRNKPKVKSTLKNIIDKM